jgi:hypothetical protein
VNAVPPVRCDFVVRRPTPDNKWRYERLYFQSYYGNTFLPLAHPPAVGDLIVLQPQPAPAYQAGGPVFRVLERMWTHAMYGSPDWPYGDDRPRTGPLLDIIVEQADGLYRDEAVAEEEVSDDRR